MRYRVQNHWGKQLVGDLHSNSMYMFNAGQNARVSEVTLGGLPCVLTASPGNSSGN